MTTDLTAQDIDAPEFSRGVRAAFDYLTSTACNHYHGNPKIGERMKSERDYLSDVAASMLEELSPADHCEWRKITDMATELATLRRQTVECKATLELATASHNTLVSEISDKDAEIERLRQATEDYRNRLRVATGVEEL